MLGGKASNGSLAATAMAATLATGSVRKEGSLDTMSDRDGGAAQLERSVTRTNRMGRDSLKVKP